MFYNSKIFTCFIVHKTYLEIMSKSKDKLTHCQVNMHEWVEIYIHVHCVVCELHVTQASLQKVFSP